MSTAPSKLHQTGEPSGPGVGDLGASGRALLHPPGQGRARQWALPQANRQVAKETSQRNRKPVPGGNHHRGTLGGHRYRYMQLSAPHEERKKEKESGDTGCCDAERGYEYDESSSFLRDPPVLQVGSSLELALHSPNEGVQGVIVQGHMRPQPQSTIHKGLLRPPVTNCVGALCISPSAHI